MKNLLKFSGIIAVGLAVVAMILMMATPVLTYTSGSKTYAIDGTAAIFGGDFKLAWTALLAWIFVLVALVVLIAGIVLPMLKIKVPVAGILNLVAVALLIVAGIFLFITKGAFVAANDDGSLIGALLGASLDQYGLGAGWVIGGILAIAGGVFAILPAAFDFVRKK